MDEGLDLVEVTGGELTDVVFANIVCHYCIDFGVQSFDVRDCSFYQFKRSAPETMISELNTEPMVSPVNA